MEKKLMSLYPTASLKKCYRNCFSLCIVTPDSSAILCPMKCFRHCTVSSFPIDFTHRDNVYFCKLGCAMSLCTNISTILFPRQVEACVDSCSDTCPKAKPHNL
ncbi:hypothetical protein RGQ29_020934 [Quercus rubra]|uniref:Thionin-like protein 2 n=1 Tax=Quercus rubra TaxID=3512 RepID=A0AAN7FEC5_QUERU|nr:hypothetical protein RGQ29_020934 [Quercus rubra]